MPIFRVYVLGSNHSLSTPYITDRLSFSIDFIHTLTPLDSSFPLDSGLDFTAYESSVCVKEAQTSSWALLNRPTQLKFENCEEKLKFPFLLANINFEPSTPELLNILRTIFSSLVAMDGSNEVDSSQVSVVCPIVGPHWERIGFQGLDPRTGDVIQYYY